MRELKANKKKKSRLAKVETAYLVKVGSFNTPNPYLLPLADFLILLNVISNNTPVPFL